MRLILIFFPFLLILSCISKPQQEDKLENPKNIILLIGDGMGISQVTAGLYSNQNKLELEKFKHIGFHKSYAFDDLIPDSGAAATALSIGKKTYNGAIGIDADTIAHKTVLELAEEKGLATGLIATSTITHATPAAFISHQRSRSMYEEIAADFLNTEIDFFVGGGIDHFTSRKDKRNLYDELRKKAYTVLDSTMTTLDSVNLDPNKNFAYLTAKGSPIKFSEGRNYLETATNMGLEFLDARSDEGFFLMIEASQIDWGGHAKNAQYIIDEFLEFDRVIGNVYDFARLDGETLVIVTADHETGGMSINYGSSLDSLNCNFSSGGHTGDLLPVFAFGPGAEEFMGIYENTAIFDKIVKAFDW